MTQPMVTFAPRGGPVSPVSLPPPMAPPMGPATVPAPSGRGRGTMVAVVLAVIVAAVGLGGAGWALARRHSGASASTTTNVAAGATGTTCCTPTTPAAVDGGGGGGSAPATVTHPAPTITGTDAPAGGSGAPLLTSGQVVSVQYQPTADVTKATLLFDGARVSFAKDPSSGTIRWRPPLVSSSTDPSWVAPGNSHQLRVVLTFRDRTTSTTPGVQVTTSAAPVAVQSVIDRYISALLSGNLGSAQQMGFTGSQTDYDNGYFGTDHTVSSIIVTPFVVSPVEGSPTKFEIAGSDIAEEGDHNRAYCVRWIVDTGGNGSVQQAVPGSKTIQLTGPGPDSAYNDTLVPTAQIFSAVFASCLHQGY